MADILVEDFGTHDGVTQADVALAIAAAANGDRVILSAGEATWTTELLCTKNIFIVGQSSVSGAGTATPTTDDQTIINEASVSRTTPILTMTTLPSGEAIEAAEAGIEGLTFRHGSVGATLFNGAIKVNGDCKQFRMHNCFLDSLNATGVCFQGDVYGVVDHCVFDGLISHPATFEHTTWGGVGAFGDNSWADDSFWGSERFVFIEDCTLIAPTNGGDGLDGFGGGRYVCRHCYLENMRVGNHGSEGGRRRGAKQTECYENTMVQRATSTNRTNGQIRGGSILFWGNHMTNYIKGTSLEQYRTFTAPSYYGACTGQNIVDDNLPNPAGGGVDYYAVGTHTGAAESGNLEDTSGSKTWWEDDGTPRTGAWDTNRWLEPGSLYMVRNITYELAHPTESGMNTLYSLSNTGTVITCSNLTRNGKHLKFQTGDTYQIWKVGRTMDQPCNGGGLYFDGGTLFNFEQPIDPCYSWDQTGPTPFGIDGVGTMFLEDRDFFNDTEKPGYTPYIYPHPLTGDAPGPQAIIILTGDMTFGNVVVGQTLESTLGIKNLGDADLHVDGISLPTGFSLTGTTTFTVAPGVTVNRTVTFAPLDDILYSGFIEVESDADSGTNTILTNGTGVIEGGGGGHGKGRKKGIVIAKR